MGMKESLSGNRTLTAAGDALTLDTKLFDALGSETVGSRYSGLPDSDIEPITVGNEARRAEWMASIKARLHFYPQGKRELSQAMYLSTDNYRGAAGSAKYLNDVLQHQKRYASRHIDDNPPYDPEAALRSIVNGWAGNVQSSRGALTALKFLGDDIEASGVVNNLAGLGNLSQVRDWRHQDWTHRAIGVMTRNHEAEKFVYEAAEDNLDLNYETSSDEAILEREARYLKSLRLGDSERLIVSLTEAHTARLNFWLGKISEARSHSVVRAQASRILEKYQRS
jgi:hypothetical protein